MIFLLFQLLVFFFYVCKISCKISLAVANKILPAVLQGNGQFCFTCKMMSFAEISFKFLEV